MRAAIAVLLLLAACGTSATARRDSAAAAAQPTVPAAPAATQHAGGSIGNFIAPRMDVKYKASTQAMENDLKNIQLAQESYADGHAGQYAATLADLNQALDNGVTVTLSNVTPAGYTATATNTGVRGTQCVLTIGTGRETPVCGPQP
jgi:hypothetical protein